jgi:membrane fusion protein (multidrug efflux system)
MDANNLPSQKSSSLYRTIGWITGIIVLIALLWFAYWFFYLQYHESTDDAYANGNLIKINAPVSGSVVAFYADDTDLVKEGQLLVALDRTEYQALYEKELASLASMALQVKQLYDKVMVNRALVENRRAAFSKAQYDHENRLQLVSSLAISKEDFVHARDDLIIARSSLKQAEEELKASQDALGDTPLEHHPLIEQQKGSVIDAYYRLKHCSIYAPATGYVAQRTVNIGQWVAPTTNMMAVIPLNYVWVDANFKETQLTYMRVGQPATVWLDMYGSDVKYQGKVIGIGFGSGSVFSLIPPQNATGNWIKIVQRLPVRISLDPETVKKYPVRLGVSAEVDVNLSNQDLPMLAEAPSTQAVGKTEVFDIEMTQLEKLLEEIVHKVLGKE